MRRSAHRPREREYLGKAEDIRYQQHEKHQQDRTNDTAGGRAVNLVGEEAGFFVGECSNTLGGEDRVDAQSFHFGAHLGTTHSIGKAGMAGNDLIDGGDTRDFFRRHQRSLGALDHRRIDQADREN